MVAVINPIPNLQTVYIAMYGRPADPQGLAYWNTITSNGTNLAPMVQFFAVSPEFVSLFGPAFAPDAPVAPSTNDIQVAINQVYLQAFGREADVAGLNYWTAQIESGAVNATEFAMIIVQEAQAADAAVVAAKLGTADAFTASIDTTPELLTYPTESGLAAGRAFLAPVVSEATQPTQAQIDAQLAAIASGEVTEGKTFTLTTGVDEFTGTAGNDLFQAEVGSVANATITTFDNINGAGGLDTLNIVGVGGGSLNAGAKFAAIEVVNINVTGAAISNLNSASFAGVQQLWQIGDGQTGTGVGNVTIGAGVVAGFRDAREFAGGWNVEVATGVASATVALDNASGFVSFSEAKAKDLTSVTLAGSTNSASDEVGYIGVGTGFGVANVSKISLALSDDTEVYIDAFGSVGAKLKTIDASGSTGDLVGLDLGVQTYTDPVSLIVSNGNFNALTDVTLGSGNDTIVDSTISDSVNTTFSLGAGIDSISMQLEGGLKNALTTVNLGAGSDAYIGTGFASNIVDATSANFEAGLVVITDFVANQDLIDLSGMAQFRGTQMTNLVLNQIASADTLFEALEIAANNTLVGDYNVFNYGGDAYVYADNGVDGFSDGDGLIQIVGTQVQQLTTENFVA